MNARLLGFALILALLTLVLATGTILDFIYFYPLLMSFVWVIGGIYFYFNWERKNPGPETAPFLTEYPMVSILIPCFNEGINAAETIDAASKQNYPNFEIIAINDGSRDETGIILDELTEKYPMLRVIHLAKNEGKAVALRMGALAARSEYLVCIDGDAVLHPNAAAYLVKPMIENPRVGAVTGNPRVRTRSSILGKLQVGEFSSIIGLIKRAQRVYGQIFTVSGVVAGFRRRAVHDCGYWDVNMVTEDIDISWSLQLKHWQIQYEPSALAWILMPETFRGLWKQRLRWARGGAEVFFKNFTRLWKWEYCRMWMLVADFCMSTVWALAYVISIGLYLTGKFVDLPPNYHVESLWPPAFWGLMLATANLFQFVVSMSIESRYERGLVKLIGVMIWYPFFFWVLSLLTNLAGLPKAMFSMRPRRAVWVSPDRGFR